ncbi:MAG: hypothetical protein ABR535_03015 [Pyrinomonadaceae bacterium]
MNSDFDSIPDFDFDEEFADELSEFEDFVDDEEEVTMRTAVLQKNNMVALLCYKGAAEGAAICRVDPREAQPAVQLYDDPQAALSWFARSLISSRKNGWNVIYDGLPLQG